MQEDPRGDRDWEHWPGRRGGDEGIRHRLRALFSATDDDALETRIEERGREIEEHTDQLQATIGDLERREARTAQLRTAVEEMLRLGSAELDERHAGLTQLSLDLAAREERIRADERDVAVRKQELGAVELRRAAVERREALVSEREAALEERETELSDRARALEEASSGAGAELVELPRAVPPTDAPDCERESSAGHVLYLAPAGYRMIERPGRAPAENTELEVDGVTYVIARAGRSPRPGDPREWAYLAVPPRAVRD